MRYEDLKARTVEAFANTAMETAEAQAERITTLEAENKRLRAALEVCQRALSILTEPKKVQTTTVTQAWAIAVEAELKARQALGGSHD